MTPLIPVPVPVVLAEPTFLRLFATLGGGVVLVTALLWSTVDHIGLALPLCLVAVVALSAVVMHEVGRLLEDEAGVE